MTKFELGAICFALQNAHNFTYRANTIEILTDHSPLIGLSKKCMDEIPYPRITSLFNKISHYNFQIKHISERTTSLPMCYPDSQPVQQNSKTSTTTCKYRPSPLQLSKQEARNLVEMAARAQDEEDYQDLIRKIEAGTNFEKLG